MFSNTTMALSMPIPTLKARPANDTTLSVRPASSSTRKAPITASGIAIATSPVETSDRRKMSSTSAASTPPCHRFSLTKSIADWMYSVSS
jgi:hypothetical protein